MIEKSATSGWAGLRSGLVDLNHTSAPPWLGHSRCATARMARMRLTTDLPFAGVPLGMAVYSRDDGHGLRLEQRGDVYARPYDGVMGGRGAGLARGAAAWRRGCRGYRRRSRAGCAGPPRAAARH